MKGLKIKIQALLLCGVLITGLFSSCASDENIDNGNKVNAGDKVLTLTLNTPKATTTSGAKTRVTNMTQTTDIGTNENQINLLTIGIFDKLGTTVRTIQELSSNSISGTTGSFTTDDDTKKTTATLVTNSLAAEDKVLVAVNATSGTFNGCTSVSEFEAKSITIDAALATPSTGTADITKEAIGNIPMYGTGSITASGTTYTSVVAIQHQLAKITLNTLGVAFDTKGPYASATFTPTSFFLINVPNDLIFNSDAWITGSTTMWQGYDNSDAGKATYKEYLGTGTITPAPGALSGSTTSTPNNVFYTMPNSDVTNNTKLVICGMFDPDGKSTSVEKVYYPVNINWVYDKVKKTSGSAHDGGTIAKSVYPNKNYICKVYIKTKGATSPTDQIDPEAVSVEVTVTPFVGADQDTTFE